jgi:hypothetical protein
LRPERSFTLVNRETRLALPLHHHSTALSVNDLESKSLIKTQHRFTGNEAD